MEVFPKIDLYPRIKKAGEFIKKIILLPDKPIAPSEYPKHPERIHPRLPFEDFEQVARDFDRVFYD